MNKRTSYYWTQTGQQICMLIRRTDVKDVHRPNVCLWRLEPTEVIAALSDDHRSKNRQTNDPIVDDEGLFYSPSGFMEELQGSLYDLKYVVEFKQLR